MKIHKEIYRDINDHGQWTWKLEVTENKLIVLSSNCPYIFNTRREARDNLNKFLDFLANSRKPKTLKPYKKNDLIAGGKTLTQVFFGSNW